MKNVSEFCKCGHCETDEQAFYCSGEKHKVFSKLNIEDYIIVIALGGFLVTALFAFMSG